MGKDRIEQYITDRVIPKELRDDPIVTAVSESVLPYYSQKAFLITYVSFLTEEMILAIADTAEGMKRRNEDGSAAT